ncbi:MAG: 2-isopropylmalate synthase, partial [Rhodothermales bacterium]|nr:2-isopropylmalate synthase [Rhodothermales bacterium]
VSVLLGADGPCFAGRATKTDVVLASAEAYIQALNSLAGYRAEEGGTHPRKPQLPSLQGGVA